MDGALRAAIDVVAFAVEVAAAGIVGGAALNAVVRAGLLVVPGSGQTIEATRLGLGRWLSLAIEFELAADIIRTSVGPSWSELGKLAAIVAIRSTINVFLQREIAQPSA